jgi:hypothetical protein
VRNAGQDFILRSQVGNLRHRPVLKNIQELTPSPLFEEAESLNRLDIGFWRHNLLKFLSGRQMNDRYLWM